MLTLNYEQASLFYKEHEGKSYFHELISHMISSEVIIICLEGNNIIELSRKLIGETNPKEAEKGTIRYSFGENITKNAIHASDSISSASREISFFFSF